MTSKREYSILPQGDRDDFHHHVHEGNNGVRNQYLCLFSIITLVIFVILAGITALTATMFYPDKITTLGQFWFKSESIGTTKGVAGDSSSRMSGGAGLTQDGLKSTTPLSSTQRNSTDYHGHEGNKTFVPSVYLHHHHHSHHNNHNGSVGVGLHGNHSGESGFEHSDNRTGSYSEPNSSEDSGETGSGNMTDSEDYKEDFAELMRTIERHMENIMGIRRAEFVIPIFMLICFLFVFTLISLCCWVMMRRKDNRRRKLFGKLITDLQTGDSKTVLLNNTDLDD